MKFLKRIAVFVFIGFLCFNSVFFSYEKAYSSDAAFAPAIPIAYEAFVALLTLLGATAVVGCTWEYMDSLDENSTPKEWEKAYNQEKELYDNFKTYYIENEGSENLYITDASGQICYLDDILENDFPDEEEFKELKKKSNNKKYDPSDWWQYGDELLDLLSGFFNDDEEGGTTAPGGDTGDYYTGDGGYIDRATGRLNIRVFSAGHQYYHPAKEYHMNSVSTLFSYIFKIEKIEEGNEDTWENVRYCLLLHYYITSSNAPLYEFSYTLDEKGKWVQNKSVSSYLGQYSVCRGVDGSSAYDNEIECTSSYDLVQSASLDTATMEILYDETVNSYNMPAYDDTRTSPNLCKGLYNFYTASDFTSYSGVSTNLPIFSNATDAKNYLKTGDASNALNLPPGLEPTPTPVPANPGTTNTTAVSTYCNSLKGKWVNSTTINNFIENLTTYIEENNITPDNSDPKYVDAVKQIANDDIVLSPTPTNVPYQGYEEDAENDGEGFSLWKFFEWLLEFFTIDMDLISSSIKVDFIPAASFQPLVNSFNKMKVAFGTDTYLTAQNENELSVVEATSINAPGKLVADYPVISCKVPKILDKYLDANNDVIKTVEGEKVIILCDFADYAVIFARFRAFLIAVMWIGMLFYLMREFQVTFNIS